MVSRHAVIAGLFVVLTVAMATLGSRDTHSAGPPAEAAIPAEALQALRDGRHLRASLILREHLATHADTAPSAIMLAARAEAGWGDWERVHELLHGRTWLDRVADGYGWHLLGRSQLELGLFREGSVSLGHYLAIADTVGSREQGAALVRRARGLAEQRQFAAAVEAYDRAAALLPHIADWIGVFAANAAASAGDTAAVRERLTAVDAMLATEWSWRTMVRARRNARDLAGAEDAAFAAADRLTSDARRAAAWSMLGSIRTEAGDRIGARTAYIRAINAAAGSTGALDAARALAAMHDLAPEHHLLIGRVFLRHGNITRGVTALRVFLDAGRGSDAERDRVRYDIADALFREGDYAAAERALLDVAASARSRNIAADALYTAARAQYRDGRRQFAMATLQRIILEFGDQPAAVRAAYLSADLEHDALALDRATDLYRLTIRFAPTSDEAAVARMRLGGSAFADGRYEDALREFEEFRRTHRAGRPYQQATFWTAQTLDRLGRSDQARARYTEVRSLDPFSYYGGLAENELGGNAWLARLEHAPPTTDRFDEPIERALARVDLLRDLGWDEAASFEMDRVRRHFARIDGASYSLAEKLNERGFTRAGVEIGREIHRREGAWNLRLLRIVYPFPFQNLVMAEAAERGVDPFLTAALIRQESMFNPHALSPVGALGLMQIMPRTGQTLARALRIPRFRSDLLRQPELNIHFGVAYLADLVRAYGDRIDAVLAAYNAGPGRVSRWQQFPEYRHGPLFAERIPFDETRNYVRIVQNNRRIYAALYGPPEPVSAR